MCGICGAVELEGGEPLQRSVLEAMCLRLQHRGPDAQGVVLDAAVALGIQRLAIIDVAGGQQPVQNETGAIQLVCNGEIYNHRSLRAELESRGHKFRSGSDCEAVVHAYEEYGLGFLERLNGMFALALWDRSKRLLILARDRMGIIPPLRGLIRQRTAH